MDLTPAIKATSITPLAMVSFTGLPERATRAAPASEQRSQQFHHQLCVSPFSEYVVVPESGAVKIRPDMAKEDLQWNSTDCL